MIVDREDLMEETIPILKSMTIQNFEIKINRGNENSNCLVGNQSLAIV
jgi:hypothetical protein